jgi:TetR/AcrR family transcriptional repressor of bet genes
MPDTAPERGERVTRVRQRQRLIDACITALHLYGPSRTTVEKVVAIAKLSPGIVRFYFDSKDAMLVASLAYLASEFEEHVLLPVAQLKADPVRALERLVELYFDPEIANSRKVSVWYSFWGEASSRAEYYEICGKKDSDFVALVLDLIERLIAERDDSHLDADAIALGLIGILEVLWQAIAFQEEANVDLEQARRRSMAYLSSVFPGRFRPRSQGSAVSASTAHSVQAVQPQANASGRCGDALPARAYASMTLLARERAELLRPAWQLVGHEAEIALAGDFLARDLAGERALVLRDEGGRLRAFRNACPHRPHALVEPAHDRLAGPLRCVTHQLTFGWDGRQLGGGGIGNLTALELIQRGPLIFVRGARPGLAVDGPPAPGELPEAGAPAGLRELAVAADWKLLVELWLDAMPEPEGVLLPNQLLQRDGDALQVLQVIPEAPGRSRLRCFRYAPVGRRAASSRWPGQSLKSDIAQVESTQLGIALSGENREPLRVVAPRLAAFRDAIRSLLDGQGTPAAHE